MVLHDHVEHREPKCLDSQHCLVALVLQDVVNLLRYPGAVASVNDFSPDLVEHRLANALLRVEVVDTAHY